jgi:hypothetical protein
MCDFFREERRRYYKEKKKGKITMYMNQKQVAIAKMFIDTDNAAENDNDDDHDDLDDLNDLDDLLA